MERTVNSELGIESLRHDIYQGICRIMIVICLIYCLLYIFRGNFQEIIPYALTISAGFFSLYLYHKERFLASRTLVLFPCNILILYTLVNTGYDHQAHIFLVILVATSFLLFENKYMPFINLFFVIMGHIICYTYFLKYGPLNPSARMYIGEYLNYILALSGAAYLSFQLFKDQQGHEQRNKDYLDQIQQKNLHLTTKNEQLENIIYIASHDLQEPLRNIQNMVNLVTKNTESSNEEAIETLQHLNRATSKMSEIVVGIMEYSRIGHIKTLEPIEMKELIDEIKADLSLPIKETRAEIQISALPTIIGYRSELQLLFQNLLSNAIKFRHPDRPPSIQIWVEVGETYYTFWVKDNGIGMDETHTKKVFHIFKKLHNSRDYQGIGIGLAHCKKIVELHEGTIGIKLNETFGMTFYFTINKFRSIDKSDKLNIPTSKFANIQQQ